MQKCLRLLRGTHPRTSWCHLPSRSQYLNICKLLIQLRNWIGRPPPIFLNYKLENDLLSLLISLIFLIESTMSYHHLGLEERSHDKSQNSVCSWIYGFNMNFWVAGKVSCAWSHQDSIDTGRDWPTLIIYYTTVKIHLQTIGKYSFIIGSLLYRSKFSHSLIVFF